ncbi:MAG TPA: EBSC protein [Ruminococcaceae bacterium]|jgi:prolyl-tRNA editing enzyme YbaK/EbsC (Cys-tRNA(Pro) deacylase)|nr:EBSC protein [Oscillospiraceae bacterium]HCM23037.1 EBSC protein [Oscillospiraceae bacterium]
MEPKLEKVKSYLANFGLANRVMELREASATVKQAAKALHVEPGRIAKTISLEKGEGCVLIVTAGDRKIDNSKFKRTFAQRAKLLSADKVLPLTGYPIGGVCPFCNPESAAVYLDKSLRRFTFVYPAAGTANSVVRLTCAELERASAFREWVDVSKPIELREQ